MTAATPQVAVLIPAYRCQESLERTLAGLQHDPAAFDVVVIDDGSEPPIVLPERLGAHRIILDRLPRNRGIEHALNAGVELILSRGYEFIARLDAGDLSLPGRIQAQVDFLQQHPDHGLVSAYLEIVDLQGHPLFVYGPPLDDDGIRRALRYNNCVVNPAVMIRASAFRDVGRYSAEFPAAEDYEFAWRVAQRFKVANLPKVYLKYELDPNGISRMRRRRQLLSRIQIQWHYFDPRDVHSYAGLAANLALLPIPQGALLALKRIVSSVTGRGLPA